MQHFEYYVEHMPLELFVLLGNFLEELISPMPSFVVLVPAGAAAEVQNRGFWSLILLAIIAGCGRILAAIILYTVARKSEEAILKGKRRFFGISHADIQKLNNKLGHTPRRDWTILFLMNGTPMFPTAPLSVACGFLQIPFRMFVSATFLGAIVNAFIYLALGYTGIRSVEQLRQDDVSTAITMVLIFVLLVAAVVFRWRRLHKRTPPKQRPKKRSTSRYPKNAA